MVEGEENNAGGGRNDSASTLLRTVETVRCAMRADTASIASFSLEERRITWLAMSGFEHVGPGPGPFVTPLRGEFAERAALVSDPIIEVRGLAGDLPASEFPLHSAEGVRDLLLVPLVARGEALGVLAVGYRASHRLSAEDRQQLEGLAAMAALALDNARLLETLGTAKRVWEQTFDAIPDGIIVHDDRLTVARCNMAAAEAMSLHPSEVAGMSCAEAFARLFGERAAAYHMRPGTARTTSSFELQAEDGRRYLVAVAPLSNPGVGYQVPGAGYQVPGAGQAAASAPDTRHPTPDTPAPAPDTPAPAPDADSSWSVVTWSDITTLAEVQEQLARSRRLATIGQLAAGVAHEINNPLAAVTTCAEATLRDLRSAPETARLAEERGWAYYLEEIVRQALRCKQITRGLLDLARQKRPRREAVDLNRVVEHAARLFEERARAAGAAVRVSLDPEVGEVATDEVTVRQILDNLLSNALDAVADNRGAVEVTTALEGGRVRVEVRDEGPGIPPDVLARVFDPFFTTKEPGRGTGLGLAISLTFAESIGAALTAESKPGSGSRFRLWLPRRAPEHL